MGALLFLGLFVATLAILDYAALRWGADTRPELGGVGPTGQLTV